jgi:hypothetical protein
MRHQERTFDSHPMEGNCRMVATRFMNNCKYIERLRQRMASDVANPDVEIETVRKLS